MARYRGPVEKIERRLDADLGLKGERRLSGKSALEKRPFAPGQHGKQFRKYFKEAARIEGNTGANLITLLERRLDNVVFRMGFATTRANARQFTTHGHVLVDGKKVDIPSFIVKSGQKIEIKEKSKSNPQVVRALELTNQTGIVDWVNVDKDKVFGIFTRIPAREEVVIPVEERLIVELYSK